MPVGGSQEAPVFRTGVEAHGAPVSPGAKVWKGMDSRPLRGSEKGLWEVWSQSGGQEASCPQKQGLGVGPRRTGYLPRNQEGKRWPCSSQNQNWVAELPGSCSPERKEWGVCGEEPWRSVSLTRGDVRGRQPGRGVGGREGNSPLCLSPLGIGAQQPGEENALGCHGCHGFVHSG